MAYHFLHQYTTEFGKDIDRIEADAQNMPRQYHFPGNIRELRNVIERAVILCDGPALTAREFAELPGLGGELPVAGEDEVLDLSVLEEPAIRQALRKAGNNQTEAARHLGIGHDALRYRLKKYGIG